MNPIIRLLCDGLGWCMMLKEVVCFALIEMKDAFLRC